MDNVTKAIILLLALVIAVSVGLANAHAFDYIQTMPVPALWDKHPTVCLDDRYRLFYSIKAIKSWEIELEKRTGDKSFDYKITVVGEYRGKCDILVKNVNYVAQDAIGRANCIADENKGLLYSCIITVQKDHKYWYTNLVHEMGHALGLGHIIPIEDSTGSAWGGILLNDDIMTPFASGFDTITPNNIDALISFYGIDGFDGNINIPKPYIIPHEEQVQNRRGN